MGVKGYTTVPAVNALLGGTLTSAQEIRAASLIEAAEAYIDRVTGQRWMLPVEDPPAATVTDELIRPDGRLVYLAHTPVTSIEEIRGRRLGSLSVQVLDEDNHYQVVSLTRGMLCLALGTYYDYLLVDYTPVGALPADLAHAAALLVAHWLQPTLTPQALGDIKRYAVGDDLDVTYADADRRLPVPPQVSAILASYRGVVFA